jgi:hypothetical protein
MEREDPKERGGKREKGATVSVSGLQGWSSWKDCLISQAHGQTAIETHGGDLGDESGRFLRQALHKITERNLEENEEANNPKEGIHRPQTHTAHTKQAKPRRLSK